MVARIGSYSLSFIPVGVAVVLTVIFPIILRSRPISNWAESYAADPHKFRWPETVDNVGELIKKEKKVWCAGAMHSCAPLIMSEGVIISLDKLNQILEINPEEKWARVQPGVCVHELCSAIKQYGLAMGTLGTIDWQTVVGAIMTRAHGGSLTTPSMHTFIDSYTLVKASGQS
jgi:FAD/FMN-containing dehydrogenase